MVPTEIAKTEQEKNEVVWNDDLLEARFYSEAVMATVKGRDKNYKTSSSRNFRALAGCIFGGNEEGPSIAMTAPVHMLHDNTGSQMSFVMPEGLERTTLPTPNDNEFTSGKSDEMLVVATTFGGWANDEKIAKNASKLIENLSDKGIQVTNELWYMGYNALSGCQP